MTEGVGAKQEKEELCAAVKTLRELVRVHGLSWERGALHIVERALGFPLGRTATDCTRCDNPIPGMPAHKPSSACLRWPMYVPHCACAQCFG